MEINRDAPVQAAAEIRIAAPIDLVWRTEADLESWPAWNPDVQSVQPLGPVAPGTTFKWKAGGMKIVSELKEVDAPRRLGWTGRTLGLRAIRAWRFTELEGGTLVRTEESFDGVLARLFPRRLKRALAASLEQGLTALRIESERRAAADRG